jgi:hypothetical protein
MMTKIPSTQWQKNIRTVSFIHQQGYRIRYIYNHFFTVFCGSATPNASPPHQLSFFQLCILFLSTALLTGMTGIALFMQNFKLLLQLVLFPLLPDRLRTATGAAWPG